MVPGAPGGSFKGGGLLAAQRGAAPVVPVHAAAARAWRLGSWDRMLIPWPFARVRIAYGEPFRVGGGDAGLVDAERRAVEALSSAVRLAETAGEEQSPV